MKKLLAIFLIFITNISFSQKKFGTYKCKLNKTDYEVQIDIKEDKYTLYIDAFSFDKIYNNGGIMLTSKEHKAFIEDLQKAKQKFIEWSKIAIENKVKEFNKDMDFKTKAGAYFKSSTDWHFSYRISLLYQFMILDSNDDNPILLVNTDDIVASDNQYMKSRGFVLMFKTEKDIDEFISLISVETVNDFIKKPKPEELFK